MVVFVFVFVIFKFHLIILVTEEWQQQIYAWIFWHHANYPHTYLLTWLFDRWFYIFLISDMIVTCDRGGVLTPGAAFADTSLLERLQCRGIQFSVVEKCWWICSWTMVLPLVFL